MKIFCFFLLFLQTVSSQSSPESTMSTEASKCEKWNCLNREFGDKFQTRNKAVKELKSTVSPHLWKALVRDVVNICFENYTAPADYENSCDHYIYSCVIEKFSEMCPERYIREGKICSTIDCEDDIRTTMCKQRRIKYSPNLSANISDEYNTKCCSLGIIFDPSVMARCGLVSEVRIHYPTHYRINSTSETFTSKTDEEDYLRTSVPAQNYIFTSKFSSDSDSSAHHDENHGALLLDIKSYMGNNENVSLYYPPDNWNVNDTRFYIDPVKNGNSKRLIAEILLIMMTIRSLLLVCVMK